MPVRRFPVRENPFIFGEVVSQPEAFVDRDAELQQVERDLLDGQKLFLLSPRRFGKSSLMSVALRRLADTHGVHPVLIPVSSYASYTQFLERFASAVINAAGPVDKIRAWIDRFWQLVRPEVSLDPRTGDVRLTFGATVAADPAPIASEVFALPETLAKRGGFRMAVCLDEFQQINAYGAVNVENSLRNAVQYQRHVGYVFSGSQPTMMRAMLAPKRPFYKAGPVIVLPKIPAGAWEAFIPRQFARAGKRLTAAGLQRLLALADAVPYDVQRLAHELWDHAHLSGLDTLDVPQVDLMTERVVSGEAAVFERAWEAIPQGQRGVLQALASGQPKGFHSEEIRRRFRLGASSTVQRALQLLCNRDIIYKEHETYSFLEPMFALWIRKNL